jgi:hypothetical protein
MTDTDISEAVAKGFRALEQSCESILSDDQVDKFEALSETLGEAECYFEKLIDQQCEKAGAASGETLITSNEDDLEPDTDTNDTDGAPALKGNFPMLTPYQELLRKAQELMGADTKLTEAKAFAKTYSDPANRDLAMADRAERAAERESVLAQRDCGDRLAERARALKKARPHLSEDQILEIVKAKNVELTEGFRKGPSPDLHGRDLPGPDQLRTMHWWQTPGSALRPSRPDGLNRGEHRVVDGSSTAAAGEPYSYGTPRTTIRPGGGDPDGSELVDMWRQLRLQLPDLKPADLVRWVRSGSPSIAELAAMVSKRSSRSSVSDRVTARASALVAQHPSLGYDDAMQRVLAKDKHLRMAYEAEQAT